MKKDSKKLFLTRFQRQVLVGTILGDAHLETQNDGISFRVKYCQSHSHKDYLFHLYEIFKDCCGAPPHQRKDGSWAFATYSSASFRFYGQIFYTKEKKKVVPRMIRRLLSPVVLAYWYMDDGSIKSKQSKGTILNTQGFTQQEVEGLIQALTQKFGLNARLRKQEEGYQIFISGLSYETFSGLISPYLHESMRYKVPSPRKTKPSEPTFLPKE